MTKEAKKYSFYATLASILAIAIAVLFFVQVLGVLDIYKTVNFVTYFVGLALIFTAMYVREKGYRKTKNACFLFGTLFIVAAIVLLVYGYVSGNISFEFTFTI